MRQEGHQACKKTKWCGAGVVICLERDADMHMAQLMPLPLTVSCFSNIHIGVTVLVPAHPGSPGKRAVKRLCVRVFKCGRCCNSRRVRSVCGCWRTVGGTRRRAIARCTVTSCTWTSWRWKTRSTTSLHPHTASSSTSQSTAALLPVRRYASVGSCYGPVSVCLCLVLSQVGVPSTEMNGLIWFLAWMLLSTSPKLLFKEIRVQK